METTTKNDALSQLLARQSHWPLTDPAPGAAQLKRIFDAAVCAPDHGALRPWRFITIQGEARAAFGDVLVDIASAREPGSPRADHEKRGTRAFRAPVIVAIVASLHQHHKKVPELEQLLAVGAATMNMLNAAFLQNLGAFWASGPDSRSPVLHQALALADNEQCLGFVYIGTPVDPDSIVKRPASEDYVTAWTGR